MNIIKAELTKKLSPVISNEFYFKVNKATVKFMKTGETFSSQFAKKRFCTIKAIQENNCNKEIQIHLRIEINKNGVDFGNLDVDFYINKNIWDKELIGML